MSTRRVAIALTICFAISSTLTFAQGSIRSEFHQDEASKLLEVDDAEAAESDHGNARLDRSADSVDPQRSFLAGEDTPVWIAYYADSYRSQLTYRKLKGRIVKQAIDSWKSVQTKGTTRRKRSVNQNMNPQVNEDGESARNHSSNSRLPERLKREGDTTVFYPSVLALMEYTDTRPSSKEDKRKLVLERIIYALAFWNSVDRQLTDTEDQRVSIRLAGIIIAQDRDATNNLYEAYDFQKCLHYEGTLSRLAKYWGDHMRQKIDFQRGTSNIVALMTDEMQSPERSTVGAFPDGPPCDHQNPGATGVLITSDNLGFSGVQDAVRAMARMLGHGSGDDAACKYRTDWKSRRWSECDLDSIRKSLASNGWCMKKPMEYHDPGKPVETILPGMFVSLERQCKADGWPAGHACTKWSCEALGCQEDYLSSCVNRHPAMDGSECGVGMICVNAQCVSTETLARS